MGRGWGLAAVLLLVALTLGVGSAGGAALVTTNVVVEVIGGGKVTSDPGNIACGAGSNNCFVTIAQDVTLKARNADGWDFEGWSDDPNSPPSGPSDCAPAGNECVVSNDGTDKVVYALFTKPSFTQSTLNVSYDTTDGDGIVTAPERTPPGTEINCGVDPATDTVEGDCTWQAPTGSTLTIFETPDNDGDSNVFIGWGGACDGTRDWCTVRLTNNTNVSAKWGDPSDTQLLTVEVTGNGEVEGQGVDCPTDCTASYALNTSVTLTAKPKDGQVFSTWSGDCSGASATCTLTMTEDKDVSATFVAGQKLDVSVVGPGSVTGGSGAIACGSGGTACSATFANNASVTLTATPALGASFVGWSGACAGATTTCTVSMNQAKSVQATFRTGTTTTPTTTTPTTTTTPSTALLSVSVTGNGRVGGGAISCGAGSTSCSASLTPNTSITLTATPSPGATFAGWGGTGGCSGTALTCTVLMTTSRSVTATFTGGTTSVRLSVSVTGNGKVTGGGINCGAGGAACSANPTSGARVTLTATPSRGATFRGWGGACSGTSRTCTVTMSSARSVTASFSGTTTPPVTGRTVLTSLAAPTVQKTKDGFTVTLRFRTTRAGLARLKGLRAGRTETNLAVRVAAGRATIGPFPVKKAGLYTFRVTLGGRTLAWTACLGACGTAKKAPVFVLTREDPGVKRTGDGWTINLFFRASDISRARVTAHRAGARLVNQRFLGKAGRITVGPFLFGPGTYTIRIRATDPYGRTRTLTWIVALAR